MSKACISRTVGIMLLMTGPLFGQDPATASQTQTLVQGNIESNVLVAPDFKFTELGGDFTGMAGLYGGWLINQKLLIGGGAYFQTNEGVVSDMRYGGAVLEYFTNPSRLVNFSVRGLVGAGSATLTRFTRPIIFCDAFSGCGFSPDHPTTNRPPFDNSFQVDETFLVAEPEANVTLNVTEKFRIGFGGGYRFVGAANGFEERLDGVTANLTAQFRF